MNKRRKAGGEIGGAATRVIKVSPQALAVGIEMPVNSAGLTDEEGRTTLVRMDQARTLQARLLGLIDVEKSELASYKLKDVAQSWYKVWQDTRALGGGPITWDLLKMAFLRRFFPR